MNPVHIITRSDDDIFFDGVDTFNFAGMETQSLKRVIAMRDGLTEMLDFIGIRRQQLMEDASDGS